MKTLAPIPGLVRHRATECEKLAFMWSAFETARQLDVQGVEVQVTVPFYFVNACPPKLS